LHNFIVLIDFHQFIVIENEDTVTDTPEIIEQPDVYEKILGFFEIFLNFIMNMWKFIVSSF